MKWKMKKNAVLAIKQYKEKLGISDVMANILINRNIDIETAKALFNEPKKIIDNSERIPGIEEVAAAIISNRKKNKTFYVFADYDVDGITSGHIMTSFLKSIGAKSIQYIPNREDGYGLNETFCQEVINKNEPAVVITVDNGITQTREIASLIANNIDVIITDHHEPNGIVWDEKIPICDPYYKPNGHGLHLCGAGVAWKVCREVERQLKLKHSATDSLISFAAIGTIADVMPMTPENMAIVNIGLQKINAKECLPMNIIMKSTGYKHLTGRSIAMKAAPLINSCGRMGNVKLAKKLFSKQDEEDLHDILVEIMKLDIERKNITKQAIEEASKTDYSKTAVCIFDASAYPVGIGGLIASRLADTYGRPAIVYRGSSASCRSIPGINLIALLSSEIEKGTVIGCAGHAEACGARINPEMVTELQANLTDTISALPREETEESEEPCILIDSEAYFSDITEDLNIIPYDRFEITPPVLLFKGVKVEQSMPYKKNHLVLNCTDKKGNKFIIVNWEGNGGTEMYDSIGNPKQIDIVANIDNVGFPDRTLKRNTTDLTLSICDMRPAKEEK